MIVLGIETATQICSAALVDDQGLLAETRLNVKNIHARKLPVIISDLVRAVDIELKDIDGIAVSIGPGSFTGLRIGLATAKGLAMAGDIPVTTVPTLLVLARQIPVDSGTIAAVLQSRKDEYYIAVYERRQNRDNCVQDVQVVNGKQAIAMLPTGAWVTGQIENLNLNHKLSVVKSLPGAHHVAQLGLEQLENNNIQPLDTLEPLYHQEFIAGKPKKPVV